MDAPIVIILTGFALFLAIVGGGTYVMARKDGEPQHVAILMGLLVVAFWALLWGCPIFVYCPGVGASI